MSLKSIFWFLPVLIFPVRLLGVDTLSIIGQTPGGSAFRVEIKDNRLFAGVGTSLWIYDITDVTKDSVLAKKKFTSIVNDIVVRDDSIVFVGANHDGLYALDARNLPDLPVLARIKVHGDTAVYDIALFSPDTLLVADGFTVRLLHFEGDTFEEITRFAEGGAIGVDVRGNRIVVAERKGVRGSVDLYTMGIPPTFVCTFDSSILYQVERVYFADLRDDIIYVCGGTANLGLTGHFFALQILQDTLIEVAHYAINGNPLIFSLASIMDMDSRNDTLFLVTMGGVMPFNTVVTDCPILDATDLPDTLKVIGHIKPGLWYFDVALKDSSYQLAIASEWYGIRWMDISGLQYGDTVFDDNDTIVTHETGGWGKKPVIRGDTLWLALQGYGVGIFDISDPTDPIEIGRIPGPFATDLILYDTLVFVAKSSYDLEIFNLRPWYEGGEPEFITRLNAGGALDWVMHLALLDTDLGPRIVYQAGDSGFYFVDPLECPNFEPRGPFFQGSTVYEFNSSGDTLFLAYDNRIAALRVIGDSIVVLADTQVSTLGKATAIGKEGNLIAVSGKLNSKTVRIYEFEGNQFNLLGEWMGNKPVEDILIRDNLIFVALGTQGLVVLENPSNPQVKAVFPGSGGRGTEFGAMGLEVGSDWVYVADYNAGCFIVDPGDLDVKEWSFRPYPGANLPTLEVFQKDGGIFITYSIPNAGLTKLKVFNAAGRLMDILFEEPIEEGTHNFFWDTFSRNGNPLPTGVYFLRLESPHFYQITKKVLVIKK